MENGKTETTLSRERILDAALATWSKDYFGKTSLADVSRALGVTKPAIYRYFKNKDALLASLEEYFAERYSENVLQPLESATLCAEGAGAPGSAEVAGCAGTAGSAEGDGDAGAAHRTQATSSPGPGLEKPEGGEGREGSEGFPTGSRTPPRSAAGRSTPASLPGPARCAPEWTALPALADGFIRKVGAFFRENPNLYAFLVGSIFRRAVEYRESFKTLVTRHAALFDEAAAEIVPDRQHRDQVVRFVGAFAVFWTTQCFRKTVPPPAHARRFDPSALSENPTAVDADIDRAARVCLRGFLSGIEPDQIDFETVERVAWFQPEEMPEPDRMLTAIEEVVSELGFENASVERIAERVGMTKSSLYFHFKNRDEMLSKMVLREQENFVRLAQTRLAALTNPGDRLYALMVMIAGYSFHNPAQLTVLNWLRYNHVEVQIPRTHVVKTLKMFRFLPQMVEEGNLAGDPQDPYPMLAFLNFIVQRELMSVPVKSLKPEDHIRRIRFLFNLFAFGIERLGQESMQQ